MLFKFAGSDSEIVSNEVENVAKLLFISGLMPWERSKLYFLVAYPYIRLSVL